MRFFRGGFSASNDFRREHVELSQNKPTREQGYGLALAGVIIGYVSIAIAGLMLAAAIIAAVTNEFHSTNCYLSAISYW